MYTHSVVHKHGDVSLIACVEEDGSTIFVPVLVCHQVALFESFWIVIAKMVNLKLLT